MMALYKDPEGKYVFTTRHSSKNTTITVTK